MHTRAPLVVGRDRELAVLNRAVADCRAARGTAVFVVGEPGIGKSRLTGETAGHAFAEGARVLRGRGSTIGPTVPFRPLAEALLSLFRSGRQPDEMELGPYRPVLGRLVPDWSRGESVPEDGSLVVLAEAVLRLTAMLGRDGGCLLVLEDLHEADAETLAVVEYLVDNLADLPTALVATIRDEPCAALDLASSAAQRGSATLLGLRRLGLPDVRELIASCLEVPPADVPEQVATRLWQDSAGNPFMVEELLTGLVDSGLLTGGADGWNAVGELRAEVPASLVRSIGNRIDRVGPRARNLLSIAAVLGHRFPLSVVQHVAGMDDRTLLSHLHAGVAAHLIAADEPAPDWYAFQHPLTGEAMLTMITPSDRADLSRRAADAIEALHPDLPGEWCQLAAALRLHTGDPAGAARLLAEAGRRALADGAATSAVALLEQAENLLAGQDADGDATLRADVLESLLYALAEAGRFDHAFDLVDQLNQWEGANLDASRRAALHVRLAYVAKVSGRPADGLAQVATARALLGPNPADEDAAPLDVAAADLAIDVPGRDRKRNAEKLARQAIDAAERVPLPAIACQAWVLLGTLARARDLAESAACFERARLLAEEHRLPIWRLYGVYERARDDWLSTGDTSGLDRARHEAWRIGAITIGYVVDASFALHAVMCGQFTEATTLIDACATAANRLRLDSISLYLQAVRAVHAAHRGQRREMDDALAVFRDAGGERASEQSLALGMARAFCALFEEDRDRARHELVLLRRNEEDNPTIYSICGLHGLGLLVDAMCGDLTSSRCAEISTSAMGRMRWNRQFVLFAQTVLLGRSGRHTEAAATLASAEETAALYPMARFLGLRLVAEAAIIDGWGEPEDWLRRAEEHFHLTELPAVASACRALLRRTGAPVRQRRSGTDRVPAALRALGVTVREYEVLQLLVERVGNKAIASRLYISPRTVEKHIASLVIKTGQPDRTALHDYAATTLAQRPH